MKGADNPRPTATMVLIAVAYVWFYNGANYVAFRVGAAHIPPLVFATLRFGLAATLIAPLSIKRLAKRPRPPARELASSALVGLMLLGYCQSATMWAAQYLTASVASLVAASSPMFLALFSWLLLKEPLQRHQVIGVLLGFSGLALTTLGWSGSERADPVGVLVMISAAATWAGGSLIARRLTLPKDPVIGLGVQVTTATALLGCGTVLIGQQSDFALAEMSSAAWSSVVFLAVASTLVGYAIFLWLNLRSSAVLANSFLYVAPVIATVLAAAMLGEEVTVLKIVAAAITLVGVAFMVRPGRARTQIAPATPRQ